MSKRITKRTAAAATAAAAVSDANVELVDDELSEALAAADEMLVSSTGPPKNKKRQVLKLRGGN